MHTISNAQIKTIRSLQQKKYRERYAQFVVEGTKSVLEFIQSDYKCRGVFAKEEWYADYLPKITSFDIDLHQANNKQLSQISALKNPQQVLAVFEIDKSQQIDTSASLILVLDDIRDPGNLGTIIRTADWFGLEQIVCSTTCADCYNPKVIQASMGSMSRMQLIYTDLQDFVQQNKDFDLVLADLDGDNVN
ncbi:MAG: TrmH family RNA methyltransferase, partial [Chitinophagales bacterium]